MPAADRTFINRVKITLTCKYALFTFGQQAKFYAGIFEK
jgi:hypothetical protein